MALTEEQRQENKKSMTKYMSVVFGGVFSYFFGYIGSMMQLEQQFLLWRKEIYFSRLTD